MKAKRLFLIGVFLVMAGFVFNFLETWYFGWNLRPQSSGEMVCDYIANGSMLIGWFTVLYAIVFADRSSSVEVEVLCPHGYDWEDCPDCRH